MPITARAAIPAKPPKPNGNAAHGSGPPEYIQRGAPGIWRPGPIGVGRQERYMTRPSTRMMCALLLEAGILTLAPPASAGGARTVSIVQPPDRFFQDGPALDVVVAYAGQVGSQNRSDGGSRLQLIVDGTVVEERVLASDIG